MKRTILLFALVTVVLKCAQAGNPDRAGEAGASELLINPWARSGGLFGMNSSRVMGLEAERVNIAGLAFMHNKTEAVFTRSHWLQGTDIFINAAGVGQKFGKDKENAMSFTFMSMNFGEIERTTTTNPEGGLGTFEPQFFNMGLGFARTFSKRIYAGMAVRIISERIDDLKAFGFCIDLGIQYVTGKLDNARFGVSLRNIGTPMKFSGDGLVFRGAAPGGDYQQSQSQRTEKFELPSQLNIGASYDIYVDNLKNDKEKKHDHRLSVIFNYASNSFGKDNVGGGLEYSWKEIFMLRGGYRWEKGINDDVERTSAHRGISAGFSAQVPLKKDKENSPSIGIDYAYLVSSPFRGTHQYGVRFIL
ncbi:MAG: PorV/PorQ family protein [Chitinophagales bacterium]|nr:PorV/PorQ family protein [Chitinophagales bacterium]